MASIVENQRRSYQAQALDAAQRLADTLANLSEAQAAAVIAVAANKSRTPVDITLQGDHGDEIDAFGIVDGVLPRAAGPYAWSTYAGCTFVVDMDAAR